jgi:dienelactone hydrolase
MRAKTVIASVFLLLSRAAIVVAQADPPLAYPLPAASALSVQKDLVYRAVADSALRFDLYRPVTRPSSALPVLVIYNGFGMRRIKQRAQAVGWASLAAASGFAAVTYDSHANGEVEDWDALIAHLRSQSGVFGIDPQNVTLMAWSGHVSRGMGLAMDARHLELKSAIFLYGVGEVASFRLDLPTLIVRAGLDTPGLNKAIDALIARGLAANAQVSVIGYGAGAHGFELVNDNALTREIVDQVLTFARSHAKSAVASAVRADASIAQAAAALYREDFALAARAYEALVAQNPNSVDYNLRLGEALLGMDQNARALAALQRAWVLNNGARARDIGFPAATAAARMHDFKAAEPFLRALLNRGVAKAQLRADVRLSGLASDSSFIALLR